jgi:hypothetical protein
MTTLNLKINQRVANVCGNETVIYTAYKADADSEIIILKGNSNEDFMTKLFTINVEKPIVMAGDAEEVENDIINAIKSELEKRNDVVVNDFGTMFAK